MIDRTKILERLDNEPGDPSFLRLRDWLQREDTRLVSDRPSKLSVSEALRLWTTRLQNTDITGQHLVGADSFVDHLKSFTPQRTLDQFALVGPEETGNLFFDRSTHRFVGAILVNTKKKT
jgi:hypothetical protein